MLNLVKQICNNRCPVEASISQSKTIVPQNRPKHILPKVPRVPKYQKIIGIAPTNFTRDKDNAVEERDAMANPIFFSRRQDVELTIHKKILISIGFSESQLY